MTRDGRAETVTCRNCGTQTPIRVSDPWCFAHNTRHPGGEMHGVVQRMKDAADALDRQRILNVAVARTGDALIVAAIRAIRPVT